MMLGLLVFCAAAWAIVVVYCLPRDVCDQLSTGCCNDVCVLCWLRRGGQHESRSVVCVASLCVLLVFAPFLVDSCEQ